MGEKDRIRKKQIRVHLSERELEIAKDKSEYCGLNMSDYIRKIIVDSVIIKYDIEGMKEICNEMNRIGVNINQIAKHINERGGEYEKNDIADLQFQFDNLFETVLNKLLAIEK